MRQWQESDRELLNFVDTAIRAVLHLNKIWVDHAVEQHVLEWEVYLHLYAMSQMLQDFQRLDELRHRIDERDIIVVLRATLNAVRVDELEVIIALLSLSKA